MKLFPLISATVIFSLAACAPTSGQNSAEGSKDGSNKTPATDISDYKSWVRVTNAAHNTDGSRRLSCVPLTPNVHDPEPPDAPSFFEPWPFKSEIGEQMLSNTAFIHIFINRLGEDAMLKQAKPDFPAGSTIVKERHPSADSTNPDYITVMRKLPAGTKPETGDWSTLFTPKMPKQNSKSTICPTA